MPRRPLIRSNKFPYHVTARVNNREDFPCSLKDAWKFLTDELLIQKFRHNIQIHAFVIMPNHFHLLVSTPKANLDQVMKEFMSSTTRIINTRKRRWGRVFGARYYPSLIQNSIYYAHALKYVYRNPVKAGLSDYVETYLYSTIAALYGQVHLPLPIEHSPKYVHRFIPSEPDTLKDWANQPYNCEESQAIHKALRKKEFKLPRKRNNGKPYLLETEVK